MITFPTSLFGRTRCSLRSRRKELLAIGFLAVVLCAGCAPAVYEERSDPAAATAPASPPVESVIAGLGIDTGDDSVTFVSSAPPRPPAEPTTVPAPVAASTTPAPAVVLPEEPASPVSLQTDALFDVDSSTLSPGADAELAAVLVGVPAGAIDITIVGFTDARGTPEHNLALSQRRATAVADWFVGQGIDPAHIVVVGRGAEFAGPTTDPAAMALDRRVEITIESR